jgi:hypothetical protein
VAQAAAARVRAGTLSPVMASDRIIAALFGGTASVAGAASGSDEPGEPVAVSSPRDAPPERMTPLAAASPRQIISSRRES